METAEYDVCYICLETFCTGCECQRAKLRRVTAPLNCACVRDSEDGRIPVHYKCAFKDVHERSTEVVASVPLEGFPGLFRYTCGYCREVLLIQGLPEITQLSEDTISIQRPEATYKCHAVL